MLKLSKVGMPQDIRLSADGKIFYVADMMNDGVFLINSETFTEVGFIATGIGAHGLTVSRDGKKIYVSNRGSHNMSRGGKEMGSVTVIDFATRKIGDIIFGRRQADHSRPSALLTRVSDRRSTTRTP